MVKIINGEIVADDDPRLKQQHQSASGPAAAGAYSSTGYGFNAPGASGGRMGGGPPAAAAGPGRGGAAGSAFDLNAPPFRTLPPAPGVQPFLGLPDAEVFGLRVTPQAGMAGLALFIFAGWRMALVAAVLYVVYLMNQGVQGQPPQQHPAGRRPAGAPAPGQQQQQAGGASGGGGINPAAFLQRYFDGPKPRSQQGAERQGEGAGGGAEPAYGGAPSSAGRGGDVGGGGGFNAFQGRGNKLGGK
ncbi:hypothetical protein Agub_g143 [Astrephomene gubernaculifera]|uniref:Uncharacterized protein n=1 Tax=Astrephomene gubernaculifera TaxID=47775 RepID=A0AAD3DFZ9_9CHLO|nr:hypothetical protein Agub_g143 [Astrephomene gubernaculifera]